MAQVKIRIRFRFSTWYVGVRIKVWANKRRFGSLVQGAHKIITLIHHSVQLTSDNEWLCCFSLNLLLFALLLG